MRRMLWLGIGLAVGALVVRAVSKKARAYTPEGIAASARDSAAGLLDSVRDFVGDIRDGMSEREAEIQAAFADGHALDDDWAGTAGADDDDPPIRRGSLQR